MLPAEEQPPPAAVSPTAKSPGYIMESEPEMEPEENDGDNEKSEGDSIDYPTSGGDNYNTLCFWVIDVVNKVTMYLLYFTRLL
nr:hypothetical protein [Tanacetum cinerariifolium]